MNQKHITTEDRIKIEVYVNEGFSARSIAEKLGFHHSTICRELRGVIVDITLMRHLNTSTNYLNVKEEKLF